MPDSIEIVGGTAFQDTYWYKSQPDGIIYVGKAAYSYKGNKANITEAEIKEGTVSLSESLFGYCKNLKNVTIPNSVTNIGSQTFKDCTSLESMILPESVINIGFSIFQNCTSLVSVNIPHGIEEMKETFWGCSSLNNIIIPDNIQKLDTNTFKNCTSLTVIYIPNSVTVITNSTFDNCINLKDVYYSGTEEEWNNIGQGNNFIVDANDCLSLARIHYNSIGMNPPNIVEPTTITRENNLYIFNIGLDNVEFESSLITVLYKEGVMIDVVVSEIKAGESKKTISVDACDADSAKIFIWSSLDSLKSLCSSKTLVL